MGHMVLRMAQPEYLAETVPSRVAAAIKESGVTTVWLCAETGIPRSTMQRRLSGHSPFNLNELDVIAKALRLPVTALLPQAAA